MQQPPSIPGADAVVAWWGNWIRFHDFHLLAVPPAGAAAGELRIHGWVTHPETDKRGYFKRSKDCVVRLMFSGIRSFELSSTELPAVLFALKIAPSADGWTATWDSSYGCAGEIEAAAVRLAVEPGHPIYGG